MDEIRCTGKNGVRNCIKVLTWVWDDRIWQDSPSSPLDLLPCGITIKALQTLVRTRGIATGILSLARGRIRYWPGGCTERSSRMDRQTRGLRGKDVLTHLPGEARRVAEAG